MSLPLLSNQSVNLFTSDRMDPYQNIRNRKQKNNQYCIIRTKFTPGCIPGRLFRCWISVSGSHIDFIFIAPILAVLLVRSFVFLGRFILTCVDYI